MRFKETLWKLGRLIQNARMSFWWEQPSQKRVDPSDQNSILGSGNGNKSQKLGLKSQHFFLVVTATSHRC